MIGLTYVEDRVQVLSFDKAAALVVASPTVTSQLPRINQFGQGKMLEENKLDHKAVY